MENIIKKSNTITSLELVKEINLFRIQDGDKSEILHKNLLTIIRDEFEEEIGMLKIKPTPYIHPQNGQTYEMFELTISQATSILARESKFVRKAIIAKLESLEKPKELSRKEYAFKLYQSEIENEELQIKNQKLEVEVKTLAPKAEYLDTVLRSVDSLTTTSVASELKMTAQKLNKELISRGIQRKIDNHYVLTAKYLTKGYASNRTHSRTDDNGFVHTTQLLVWTEYGKAFLHSLFNINLSFSKKYIPQLN